MDYKDCKPIASALCTLWLIESKGREILAVWHKDAKIEDIVMYCKLRYNKFTIMRVDNGIFDISAIEISYSGDARKINQDMEIVS